MARQKPRHIVVDGERYGWRFSSGYGQRQDSAASWLYHDIFTAWPADRPGSRLHVHFITPGDLITGSPLGTGLPIVPGTPDTGGINLHRPKLAAELIRQARQRGWTPGADAMPFVVENGLELLAAAGYAVG